MKQYVYAERRNDIAIVTLNNSDSLNAINAPMRDAIVSAMGKLNSDIGIRAIVLTGAGERAFSSGQDLAEAASFKAEEVAAWMTHQRAMFQSLRDLEKPLVVAFNGIAAGTGFQMGLLADIRIGYPDMLIGQPEVRVGLASILGSYLMTLYLSHSHNVELSLLGELITGQRALEIGLLNHVVNKDHVLAKAIDVAEQFARLPSNALRLTKERFRLLTQPGFEDACEAVIRYHRDEYATGEPQEIMLGFLETRAKKRASRQAA
jgi:enoyl-CoA hydratase/carnithine racemase